MPCSDGGPRYDDRSDLRARLDEVTRVACQACEALERHDGVMPHEVRLWWEAHKKADEERRQKEQQDRQEQKRRLRERIQKLKQELGEV